MAQSGKITAKDQKATETIAAAIKALGGEKNINGINSLILIGTSKHLTNEIEQEIELRILLPDSFLLISKRIDINSITYQGVSKGELRNASFDSAMRNVTVPRFNSDDELKRFACLLLGALLKSDPVAPLTLSSVANTSDKFIFENARGVLGEIEFDPGEKYPMLIKFKDVLQLPPQMTQISATQRIFNPVPTGPGETTMLFKDRSAVNGVMFPKVIVWESGNSSIRELRFDKIQINPKLTLADFEIPQ